jgi:hypothetical protein
MISSCPYCFIQNSHANSEHFITGFRVSAFIGVDIELIKLISGNQTFRFTVVEAAA